jgi:hypothetical protein
MNLPKGHGFVYVLCDYNLLETYKIGITNRNPQTRLAELNQSPGSAVKLIYLSPATDRYKSVERRLHTFFKSQQTFTGENRTLREWFVLSPDKFQLLKELLKYEFVLDK